MKIKNVFAPIVCIFIIATLFVAGCGKDEPKTVKTPEGKVTIKTEQEGGQGVVRVESEKGKVTVTTGGQQTVSEAELGVPIYPGAKTVSTGQFEGTRGSMPGVQTYMFVTTDGQDKVASFYKSNLKDVSQEITQTAGNKKTTIFTIGKKGAIHLQVSGDVSGGETTIQVMKVVKK